MANLGSIIGDGLESVSKFAPDRFRAQFMLGLGYAANNRFTVELPSIDRMSYADGEGKVEDPLGQILGDANGETRNMLCTAAGIPGKQINVQQRQIGSENRPIAMGQTFPEVNLTFYLTNTYSMRKYWGNWMKCITSQDPKGKLFVGYFKEYVKDITIRQYTKNARRVMGMKLIDAFPTNMSTIEFNNQPQTAVQELTVSIAYRTFEEDYREYSL